MKTNKENKKEVFKIREETNDQLKSIRQELKLGARRTDLQRIKIALKMYHKDKISLEKLMNLIRLSLKDKYFAGLSQRWNINANGSKE